jgi:hypothetical protein
LLDQLIETETEKIENELLNDDSERMIGPELVSFFFTNVTVIVHQNPKIIKKVQM